MSPREAGSEARAALRLRLESERDDLLGSIRDLEREHELGDLDDSDYERLRARYTVAAADVLRRLDSLDRQTVHPPAPGAAGRAGAGDGSRIDVATSKRRARTIGVLAAVVVFAAASGIMVARTSGQRGAKPITGVQGSIREQLATCQPLAFSQPREGVECYASILEKAPDNVEALTYQGWAMVRAGDVAGAGSNFARVVEIDPTYPDVRVFRAVIAVRGRDFATAAAEIDEFYRNDPSDMAIQVLQSQGLEREIFFGLQPEPVRNCWQTAAEAGEDSSQLDERFYTTLGSCLDGVLGTGPDDVDALVSRAFAAAGAASLDGGSTIDAAVPFLDRALALDPTNANALVLRAGLNAVNGNEPEAEEDLVTLEGLERPTISFLTGSPAQIAAGV